MILGARRGVDTALAGLLAAGVGVMFLPWARSGRASRDSFELARSADRLGLLDGAGARIGVVLWLALPFLAAIAIGSLALGHRRLGRAISAGVGLGLLGGVWVVKIGPLPADGGMTVALLVGALILALAAGGANRFVLHSASAGSQTPEPDEAADRHDEQRF